MQLTVRDVAKVLKVGENVIYHWVATRDLPAEQINGQYRFNRIEVLEWATHNMVEISPAFCHYANGNGGSQPHLDEALAAGGICYGIQGTDKTSVLRAVVHAMPLLTETDRDSLLQVMLSRESLGSTSLGDGIALPHPRYPAILSVPHPFITLCFLEQPIPYQEGHPLVQTLFAIVSPTMRIHLGLLARLSCVLRDPGFREIINRKGPAREVLTCVRHLEDSYSEPTPVSYKETA